MTARVKKRITFDKKLRKAIKKAGSRSTGKKLRSLILATIRRGRSPVQGGRWDKPYSVSYSNAIKSGRVFPKFRTSPVNLKVSSELHRSLSVDPIPKGYDIEFSDFTAIFHDREGAGKAKAIRRMLPHRGEKFIPEIMRLFKRFVRQRIRRATR